MFQRPQLQTGEEERLPGSLQQGDWPRALRTDERSVASFLEGWCDRSALNKYSIRTQLRTHSSDTHEWSVSFVAVQRTLNGRAGSTHHRFNGRLRTPRSTQALSTRSHVLLNFTVTPVRVPGALCLVCCLRCRCGAPAWGAGGCAACAFSISISLTQPKKAVKLPALCVARLLWIL